MLGVSTYNNPLIKFKTYGFIINMTIAFTSLFHAIFEKKALTIITKIEMVIQFLSTVKKKRGNLNNAAIITGKEKSLL